MHACVGLRSSVIVRRTQAKCPLFRICKLAKYPVSRIPVFRIPVFRIPVFRIPVSRKPVFRIPVSRIPVSRICRPIDLLREGVTTRIVETKLFEEDEGIETARSLVR